jgi:lipopolysaccharide export LptBFGC system permease protein LptF
MSFYAKAALAVIAFWSFTGQLWNLQATHPWWAAALVFIVFTCVIIIGAKKGKR